MCTSQPTESAVEMTDNNFLNDEAVENNGESRDDNNQTMEDNGESREDNNQAVDDGSTTINAGSNQLSPVEHINDVHIAAEFVEKIHNLKYTLESDIMACDAKWTLFVAAAVSYRYDSNLKPFPRKFVSEQKGCNIDALMSIINDTPKLKVVRQNIFDENYDEFDTDVVDLLHWVLVELREPLLSTVDKDEFNNVVLSLLPEQDGQYIKPTQVFEVCQSMGPVESNSEESFTSAVRKLPAGIAFYGDKLDSFFSIIHGGFQQVLNRGHGDNGLNLCTELATVIDRSPIGAGWGASACGSMISCVALCEYINDKNYIKSKTNSKITHVHVSKHELVRIRYLLFYGSHFPDENSLKSTISSWIVRYKYPLSLVCYAVVLTSIGVANSNSGRYLKHLICKKAKYLFDFCKKIFVADT